MKKFIRKNNKGTSLVEALISMLILAIIVVPLLSNFLVASRANTRSKQMQQATALGSNILELIKEIGLQNTARQFDDVDPFIFSLGELVSYEDLTPGLSTNANGLLRENPNKEYTYKIENIEQGTSVYDVKISFNATKYDGTKLTSFKQNMYEFPDLSAFNTKETLIINPNATLMDYELNEDGEYELVAAGSFDEKAIDYFYDLHENYYYSLWIKECEQIDFVNSQRLDEYADLYQFAVENNLELPSYPSMELDPEPYPLIDRDIFRTYMTRHMNIEISEDEEGKIFVNASFVYDFDNSTSVLPDGITQRSYSGFCSYVDFESIEEIKNIYVFYTYFNENQPGFDYITVDTSSIVMPFDKQIKLFIAMQQEDSSQTVSLIPVEVDLDTSHFEVFSQGALSGSFSSTSYNNNLIDRLDAKDRLYDVCVEIFSEESNLEEENKITELVSSINES